MLMNKTVEVQKDIGTENIQVSLIVDVQREDKNDGGTVYNAYMELQFFNTGDIQTLKLPHASDRTDPKTAVRKNVKWVRDFARYLNALADDIDDEFGTAPVVAEAGPRELPARERRG